MRKLFILLAVVGLCGHFNEKAQAQPNWKIPNGYKPVSNEYELYKYGYRHNFFIHAGYAPEKNTQKTSLGEKKTVRYQGFYVGGLYSSGIFAIGPQLRYQYMGSSNNDASFNGILPEKQLLFELPILVYFPGTINNRLRTEWDNKLYVKHIARVIPFIGVMPSYKYSFGIQNNYKPIDVYGLAGLLVGRKHLNVYLGLRVGLLDMDKGDDTKTSAFGMFYGFAYSF